MSSRSLDDLRPEFRAAVDAWLADCKADGLDLLVYCTLRARSEQAALYAQGRTLPGRVVTNAKPGESAHNYGLALDFVPLRLGKPDWEPGNDLYLRAIRLAMAHGLESLAQSSFPEWAHIQRHDWKTIAEAHSET